MSSRVIKFRVWDTEYKEFSNWTNRDPFFNVSHGQLFFWERVQKEDGSYDGDIILEDLSDRFILQQFTGLHDKDGKEIYEGDILKETHYEYSGRFTDLVRDPAKLEGYPYRGVVYWTEGIPCNTKDSTDAYALLGFRTFPLDTTVGQVIGNSITRNCEILGNMYENPEMMEHGPHGPKYAE
jgi:uncharacterized phage protein (TIGR01671 family)